MRKLTRKLFISILSMAFAVIAIGTTTFAWITISTTADINQFQATVETGAGGIELSLDKQTWTNSLDITENDFENFKGELSDVTLTDAASETFKELVINNNTATYADIDGQLPYIKIQFWVRNTNPATGNELNVSIAQNSVVFGGTEPTSYLPDVDVTGFMGETGRKSMTNLCASNAARMMATDGTNRVLYQKDGNALATTTDQNTLGSSTSGFAYNYFTAKGISFGDLSAPTGLDYKVPSVSDQTIISNLGSTEVLVTLYVWIEGWDNECHADILKDQLTVSLKLNSTKAN